MSNILFDLDFNKKVRLINTASYIIFIFGQNFEGYTNYVPMSWLQFSPNLLKEVETRNT